MFGIFEKKQADVIDHWYALIPGFNVSTKEFYEAIEKELKEREVPGLEIFHVDFAEGGVMSSKREYLRMTRERLVFDICAAPFGKGYFFSCRFAEIPAVIRLWQLLVVLVGSFMLVALAFRFLGLILGAVVLLAGFVFLIYTLRNAVSMGLRDLDATLIKSPVFGPIYENWFRKETYYRQDTRLMYRDTVNDVVKAQVEETTGAKGIKLIKFNDYSPILGELYKPTTVQISPKA
jgi:hypothetical protein